MGNRLLIEILLEAKGKSTPNMVAKIYEVIQDLNRRVTRVTAEIRSIRTDLGRDLNDQEFEAFIDKKVHDYVSKHRKEQGGD